METNNYIILPQCAYLIINNNVIFNPYKDRAATTNLETVTLEKCVVRLAITAATRNLLDFLM